MRFKKSGLKEGFIFRDFAMHHLESDLKNATWYSLKSHLTQGNLWMEGADAWQALVLIVSIQQLLHSTSTLNGHHLALMEKWNGLHHLKGSLSLFRRGFQWKSCWDAKKTQPPSFTQNQDKLDKYAEELTKFGLQNVSMFKSITCDKRYYGFFSLKVLV